MTDYIVAIDLGTSHITGIVGEKKTDGTFSIIACETENSDSCIRRGIIYNRDSTTIRMSNVIRKLESKLKGDFIDKIYVGVNGQSLHTVDHIEVKDIVDEAITNEDLEALREQCEKYSPNLQDVLDIAPAVYYIDGRRDIHPVGVACKRFEAHYKLVTGRSSIRRDIVKSISGLQKQELAGIIVSPLALADAMLSKEDKELGCALVDFGAGVTSVSIYKNGDLLHMSVIPLGGNLITRDITSLQITEADAENLKKEYGNVILQKDDEDKVLKVGMEGEIGLKDLNTIIEGRAKEIVENVYARINEVTELKSLGSGIILAGCASELKNLTDLIKDKCKVKVRPSAIREELIHGSDEMLGNPLYMTAISLMLKGTEQCITRPFVQPTEQSEPFSDDMDEKPEETKKEAPPKKTKNKGKGLREMISDIFGNED